MLLTHRYLIATRARFLIPTTFIGMQTKVTKKQQLLHVLIHFEKLLIQSQPPLIITHTQKPFELVHLPNVAS